MQLILSYMSLWEGEVVTVSHAADFGSSESVGRGGMSVSHAADLAPLGLWARGGGTCESCS
jgi:hypothetical protein